MIKEWSIANGYRNILISCTLYCNQDCPHCYLSKEDKSNKNFLSINDFEKICINIKNFFDKQNNPKNEITFSWYGGEITLLDPEYFFKIKEMTDKIFYEKKYNINHYLTSNLINLNRNNIDKWIRVFKEVSNNHISTSCDYLMRGKNYLKKWKEKVKILKENDVNISMITVVNKTLIEKEQELLNIYTDLKLDGITFLPIYKTKSNIENNKFDNFYIPMDKYTEFLINIHKLAFKNFPRVNFNSSNVLEIMQKYHLNKNSKKIMNGFEPNIEINYNGSISVDVQIINNEDKYNECIDNIIVGNILNTPLEEILSHKIFKTIHYKFENYNNNQCNNCEYYSFCLLNEQKNIYADNSGECMGSKEFVKWIINFYENLNFIKKRIFDEDYLKTMEENFGDMY